ncbi:dephospho-CoA kinase [Thiotrichales bacterium 19S3-7]|nr:dephospho-CoA kinase [Thiotrichales bacterium 19S3-7]MCF6801437.1 dephospho-CoA kinase [Thiotrichales bacterium 19S3-11]
MLGNLFCVCITGGIASGKSTVVKLFQQLDIDSVCADTISKDILKPSSPLLHKIVNYFGDMILQTDGNLDRKALGKLIFDDTEKRLWLENLLHPIIREEIKKQAMLAQSPYCVIDIPLLFKHHTHHYLDYIITIDTPMNIQISRLINRDHQTIESAYQIINTQPKRSERYLISNYIIQNIYDKHHLKKQVESIHQHLLTLTN